MVKEFVSTEHRHPVRKKEKNNAQYCGVAAEAASAHGDHSETTFHWLGLAFSVQPTGHDK